MRPRGTKKGIERETVRETGGGKVRSVSNNQAFRLLKLTNLSWETKKTIYGTRNAGYHH